MTATKKFYFLFSILLSMVGTKALAYDIAIENDEGVTIYYNYINDGTELEVAYETDSYNSYSGSVVIPEEVTYMNKTRKVTSIGDYSFYRSSDLVSVTIPESITSIGNYVFYECGGLTSITIPNSVKSIGLNAFYKCYVLTYVIIGNSVSSIHEYTFYGCSGLTSIMIPNSVTSIGDWAFNCCGLTSITIPNSVTSIGNGAFWGCSGLTSVTIPKSVTSIGESAFYGCKLSEVISKIENPFNINPNTFSDKSYKNATLYVPAETIDKYKATEGWKKFAFIEEEGSPSSIKDIESKEERELNRYTQDGKMIKYPQKGINIIQMNNGKTKKMVVKR